MRKELVCVPGLLLLSCFFLLSCKKKDDVFLVNPKPDIITKISNTIWGSSCAPYPDEVIGRPEAWQRLNTSLKATNGGFPLQARRSYDTSIPANFAASAMAEDVGLCNTSISSFKPTWGKTADGSNNAAMKAYIQSIPSDRVVYLIFHHEPENDVTVTNTADILLRDFGKFVDVVLTSGKPNVHPCFNLMSYTFRTQSGRNPDDFNMAKYVKPEQLKEVIAALDGYSQDPAESAKSIFEAPFTKMASWGFTRFGIFETGVHATSTSTSTAKADWIKGLGQWVNSRADIEVVSWFNSGLGSNAGPTGWYLGNWYKNGNTYTWDDADGTIRAYAQLLKK